jgi:hypothetical protein
MGWINLRVSQVVGQSECRVSLYLTTLASVRATRWTNNAPLLGQLPQLLALQLVRLIGGATVVGQCSTAQ